jgi:hypothetical protein
MRWCAPVAAGLALAMGIWAAFQAPPPQRREPRWAARLAPLVAAPIPAGEAVALLLPAGLPEGRSAPLLFEAAWQRPDLRWALLDRWPGAVPPRFLVVLRGGAPPEGWRPLLQVESLVVLRRATP